MFDRKRPDDVERLREDSRRDLEQEREKLQQEREALQQERERLERVREQIEAREDELEDLEDELEDLQDSIEDHVEEIEDAESVREILDVVSDRIPKLISGVQEAVYSPEQSKQLALSIAEFYKTLTEAGMDPSSANALTITHMSNLQHSVLRRTARLRVPEPPRPPAPPARRAPRRNRKISAC